ncbi:MAG: hypothetical protein LUF68_04225 [Clostridiales bacterium]|nr:hypothetical protein [Clostridiales bacterium]
MKKRDIIAQLEGILENTKYQIQSDDPNDIFGKDAEALREAIKRLNTPSDRCLANEILIVSGLILGGVGTISAICGVIYILMGDFTAAWALLPWALLFSVFTLLAFAGVRK